MLLLSSGSLPLLDWNFSHNSYRQRGSGSLSYAGITGSNFSRASQAYFVDADGSLASVGSGVLRRRSDGCLVVGPGTTNLIRNPSFSGGSVGAFSFADTSRVPTNMRPRGTLDAGLTATFTGFGTEAGWPYAEIRLAGTSGSANGFGLYFETVNRVVAARKDTFAHSFYAKVISATGSYLNLAMSIVERTAGGAGATGSGTILDTAVPTSSMQRFTEFGVMAGSDVAFADPGFEIRYDVGALDVTIRVYAPQIEKRLSVTDFAIGTRADDALALPNFAGTKQVVYTFSDGSKIRQSGVSLQSGAVSLDLLRTDISRIEVQSDAAPQFNWVDQRTSIPLPPGSATLPYLPWLETRFSTQDRSYMLQRDLERISAFRMELRNGDQIGSGGVTADNQKSEIQPAAAYRAGAFQSPVSFGDDVWQSWSFYLEPRVAPLSGDFLIIGQWHATEDGPVTAPARAVDGPWYPPVSFQLAQAADSDFVLGQLFLRLLADPNAQQPSVTIQEEHRYSLTAGALQRGVWHNIVTHFVFGFTGNTAIAQVWLDGTQVVNASGINIGYNDVRGPHFNWGLYRGYQSNDPNTDAIIYANMETSYSSLLSRVGNPRPI